MGGWVTGAAALFAWAARALRAAPQLHDDVYTEAVKCGTVLGLAIPVPPPHVGDSESARVYVKYTTQARSRVA